jgi:hypothetical protein
MSSGLDSTARIQVRRHSPLMNKSPSPKIYDVHTRYIQTGNTGVFGPLRRPRMNMNASLFGLSPSPRNQRCGRRSIRLQAIAFRPADDPDFLFKNARLILTSKCTAGVIFQRSGLQVQSHALRR